MRAVKATRISALSTEGLTACPSRDTHTRSQVLSVAYPALETAGLTASMFATAGRGRRKALASDRNQDCIGSMRSAMARWRASRCSRAYPTLGPVATAARVAANSVAAFSDGTIIATVPQRPGTTDVQRLRGEPTGDVMEWKPGTDAFRVLPGTSLAGNNGIEISLDETEFYVVSFGAHTIVAFSRRDPRTPLRQSVAPGFMPDNLRRSGDRLIAAGPMYDEPACGGTRLAVVDNPVLTNCHRGFVIAQLEPRTMAWTVLAYAEPNPARSRVATGVLVGETVWIGAATSDAIAFRPLPRPAGSPTLTPPEWRLDSRPSPARRPPSTAV